MFRFIFQTEANPALLFVRLALGIVVLPHGMQKLFGLWGGPGVAGTIDAFYTNFGFFPAITLLVIATEFLGAIGLITGFLTRVSALGIGTSMTVCALLNHVQNGFFMNWFGAQKGEGFEYHILILGMALALVWKGGGALSLDRYIAQKVWTAYKR